MATTSAIPLVKAKLKELLTTAFSGTGVQVTYSAPLDAARLESVFMGDSRADQTIPVSRAGRQARQEVSLIDVHCNAVKAGDDASEAEARAFEIAGEVEDALAEDPTLGGLATVASKVRSIEALPFIHGETGQWACQVTLEVEVTTRLS